MNIQPVGWLDTLVVLGNLRLRHWERLEGDGDVQTVLLRDEEGEASLLKKGLFKSMQSFLARLSNEAAPFLGNQPAELGRAWIECLRPGRHTGWTEEPAGEWLQLRICLATPPNAWLYCGGESAVIQPGVIAYVNVQAPTSSLNLGTSPRLHLVVEVKKPLELT